MFDIGWSEMLVIAIVLIVVVGPKDLPRMLRTFGKTTAKLRAMAGDFQRQFNEALKEAELDDVKKSVDELRSLNPKEQIRKQLNPFEQAASDIRSGLDSAMKSTPAPASTPASEAAQPAEPVKAGATAMPGVAGPDAMPPAPVFPATEQPATPVAAQASVEPARKTRAAPKAAKPAGAKAKPAASSKAAAASGAAKAKPAAATKTAARSAASKPAAKPAAEKSTKPKATSKTKKAAPEKTSAGSAK